jgi:hypothetical protein
MLRREKTVPKMSLASSSEADIDTGCFCCWGGGDWMPGTVGGLLLRSLGSQDLA